MNQDVSNNPRVLLKNPMSLPLRMENIVWDGRDHERIKFVFKKLPSLMDGSALVTV